MRIELLTSNDSHTPGVAKALSLWRVGAILDATAARDATTGQLWLNIADRRLPVRIASGDSAGPTEGEQLKLRVLRDSPVLALEVVDTANDGDVTGDALRRNLPKQTLPTPLLANLAWLARNPGIAAALPPAAAEALERLWQALPKANSLSDPTILADALQKSGVFLESALGSALESTLTQTNSQSEATVTLAQDFKALLLSLKKNLGPQAPHVASNTASATQTGPLPILRGALTSIATAPASLSLIEDTNGQLRELAQQTEGSLARVNSTQLINAEAARTGISAWLIELPVRHEDRADLLRFRFEREEALQAAVESSWAVEVAMDLGASGNLHARVSLYRGRCAVQLRSESPLLVEALTKKTHALTASLQAAGLLIDRVVCLHGAPIRDPGERAVRLLDLRA